MMKRIFALIIAILMGLCTLSAYAEGLGETPSENVDTGVSEGNESPAALYYTGGVVLRTIPRDAESSELLQLAYVLTDSPYIILDQNTTWELTVTGGVAPYEVTALLAYQDDLDMDPFYDEWSTADYFSLTDMTFDYTFTGAGRYFWQFGISDSNGQYLSFQTQIYETYTPDNEGDMDTVVGMVNVIVAELITDDMSDYSRARVLHDWLIYNANYDYSYTYYEPSGVLLYGTGVCESYATAYAMLCTAAGLDCMCVSGTAGTDADPTTWGAHSWNLVKLGGTWYHVDCTWDDPNDGGCERHTYFCLDDETMAKDHRWNTPEDVFYESGTLIPDAEGGEYEPADTAEGDYDFTFATIAECESAFDAMVAAGEYREKTVGLYVGDDDTTTVWNEFGVFVSAKAQELSSAGLITNAGCSYNGNLFTVIFTWTDPDDYVRIDEETLRISVGETVSITPSEYVPQSNAFTWTSSDTAVATVSASYTSWQGLTAEITGVSTGTATITVTSADGLSDSVSVIVLPPYQPDLALSLTETDGAISLTWEGVPGVTSYTVVRTFEGTTSTLATTSACSATLTAELLPSNVRQTVHVVASRVVNGEPVVSYQSDAVSYGEYVFTYTATLPADTLEIGAEAFIGNTSLTSVSINDGVTTIGSNAFAGCSALYVVRIPASVTSIGDGAFDGSTLKYAVVTKDSCADTWMQQNCPDVILVYK